MDPVTLCKHPWNQCTVLTEQLLWLTLGLGLQGEVR